MDLLSREGLKLAIGSDHAGYRLKEDIKAFILDHNIAVEDFGTDSEDSVDYPDIGGKVARAVAEGKATAGILICGTGIGMSIVANKIKGIRAALCLTPFLSEYSRRHNDANILCLAGRLLSPQQAREIVEIWLKTPFEGGRHKRRIDKIEELTCSKHSE